MLAWPPEESPVAPKLSVYGQIAEALWTSCVVAQLWHSPHCSLKQIPPGYLLTRVQAALRRSSMPGGPIQPTS